MYSTKPSLALCNSFFNLCFLCAHSFTALLFVYMVMSESGCSCVPDSADGNIKCVFSRFSCDRKQLRFLHQPHQHKSKETWMQSVRWLCIPDGLRSIFSMALKTCISWAAGIREQRIQEWELRKSGDRN